MVRPEQQREEKTANCVLKVLTFYCKSVSFGDEFSFSEDSDKLSIILCSVMAWVDGMGVGGRSKMEGYMYTYS